MTTTLLAIYPLAFSVFILIFILLPTPTVAPEKTNANWERFLKSFDRPMRHKTRRVIRVHLMGEITKPSRSSPTRDKAELSIVPVSVPANETLGLYIVPSSAGDHLEFNELVARSQLRIRGRLDSPGLGREKQRKRHMFEFGMGNRSQAESFYKRTFFIALARESTRDYVMTNFKTSGNPHFFAPLPLGKILQRVESTPSSEDFVYEIHIHEMLHFEEQKYLSSPDEELPIEVSDSDDDDDDIHEEIESRVFAGSRNNFRHGPEGGSKKENGTPSPPAKTPHQHEPQLIYPTIPIMSGSSAKPETTRAALQRITHKDTGQIMWGRKEQRRSRLSTVVNAS